MLTTVFLMVAIYYAVKTVVALIELCQVGAEALNSKSEPESKEHSSGLRIINGGRK